MTHEVSFRGLLSLAPFSEPRLLRTIMRTRFQFVVFADVAIEVNNLLFGFADFRHRHLLAQFWWVIRKRLSRCILQNRSRFCTLTSIRVGEPSQLVVLIWFGNQPKTLLRARLRKQRCAKPKINLNFRTRDRCGKDKSLWAHKFDLTVWAYCFVKKVWRSKAHSVHGIILRSGDYLHHLAKNVGRIHRKVSVITQDEWRSERIGWIESSVR